MSETVILIIAILFAVLAIIVIYKHIDLTIQIKDILNVSLKANKDENEEEPDSQSDSSRDKN